MISEAEKAIGYTFKNKSLLKRALTLASASEDNNQLLEFFGDAILEFIVSERIFREESSEGALTERRKNLVADSALTPVSEKLGLDKLLIRAKKDNFNKKAIPSAYEAVVAAIYLDGGMDAAKKFVLGTLDFKKVKGVNNYKGALQEFLQSRGERCPDYVCKDVGTKQKADYIVTITVLGKTFSGEAGIKKQAEMLAAKSAMEYIKTLK